MSSITDWKADYSGADLNVPADATAIPFPANTTTDLGETLRDTKAVIRQESLNKGWFPDAYTATFVNTTKFTVGSDITAFVTTGSAIKAALGANTVFTFARDVSYGAPNTSVIVGNAVLTNALTTVIGGAFRPPSNPLRNFQTGYPLGIGSSLPPYVSQLGRFMLKQATTTVTVPFTKTEQDTNYRPLIQPVTFDAYASLDALRITTISKATTSMDVTIAAAVGGTNQVEFEFALVRGA